MSKVQISILLFTILYYSIQGIDIKTVGEYTLLSPTINNAGPSIITGNMGADVTPTGFPPGVINGNIYAGIPRVTLALTEATNMLNEILGKNCTTSLTGTELGGMTLYGGVYCFASTAQVSGILTLDGQNNADTEWFFQIGSALLITFNSQIRVINGGNLCNVYWGIGSSATFNLNSTMVGNYFAYASLLYDTDARLNGRNVALTGAITLNTNDITNTCGSMSVTTSSDPTSNAASDSYTTDTLDTIPPNIIESSSNVLVAGFILIFIFV